MSATSGHLQLGTHSFDIRIYYEDTDVGGVVYHSNYLNFAERARTELLRFCGIYQEELRRLYSCVFVVTELNIKYKEAARLDDVIQVRTTINDFSAASFRLTQSLWVQNRHIAEITVTIVAIHSEVWRVIRFPEEVVRKIMEGLHG